MLVARTNALARASSPALNGEIISLKRTMSNVSGDYKRFEVKGGFAKRYLDHRKAEKERLGAI